MVNILTPIFEDVALNISVSLHIIYVKKKKTFLSSYVQCMRSMNETDKTH